MYVCIMYLYCWDQGIQVEGDSPEEGSQPAEEGSQPAEEGSQSAEEGSQSGERLAVGSPAVLGVAGGRGP